jgi:hypothetical protein
MKYYNKWFSPYHYFINGENCIRYSQSTHLTKIMSKETVIQCKNSGSYKELEFKLLVKRIGIENYFAVMKEYNKSFDNTK